MSAQRSTVRRWAEFGIAVVVSGCSIDSFDPVHESEVDALGAEQAGVPPGPMHRPGQPCTVCHGGAGPAPVAFVLAGTVFAAPDQVVGLDQAEVLLVDSLGSSPPSGQVVTNCSGNFYLTAEIWNPAFPVLVGITSGSAGAQMVSHIGRAGSCASCHTDPRGLDSPGRVFVQTASTLSASAGCTGSPGWAGP